MTKLLYTILGMMLFSGTTAKAQNSWADEGLVSFPSTVKQRCYEALHTSTGVQKGDVTNCQFGNKDLFFDRGGKCIKALGYTTSEAAEWNAVYTYMPDGKSAEMVLSNTVDAMQNKTIYKYNDAGSVTEENLHKPNGDLIEKLTYTHDPTGNKRMTALCYKPDGSLRWKETYEYDQQGKKTGYKHYDKDNNLDWQTVYKYDKQGSVIEEGSYDESFSELSRSLYEYTYDDYDNWIKRTVFSYDINKTKVPENIVEREMIYY